MSDDIDISDVRRRLIGMAGRTVPPDAGIIQGLRNRLLDVDPNVDPSGVPHHTLRARLSRADTPEEREGVLTEMVGEGGWGLDTYGRYMVTPQGMDRLGLKHSDKPTRIDEPYLTQYDLADLTGDLPAMAGATATGFMTGGMGVLPAIAMSVLGGAGGKGGGELGEFLAGENKQTLGEVVLDVAQAGLEAGAGEGIMRGALIPLGKKIMAPQAKRITSEVKSVMEETVAMGGKPSVAQVTEAPILGRVQGMIDKIFGDPNMALNREVLKREMKRLATRAGPKLDTYDVGELVKADIRAGRKAVANWAQQAALRIDEITEGVPILQTTALKQAARDLVGELPINAQTGKPVLTSNETLNIISDINSLPDSVTFGQMQRITNKLWQSVDDRSLVPGLSSHDAKELWLAATKAYDQEIVGFEKESAAIIQASIKFFRNKYKEQISKFDDALIQRIVKDDKFAGNLPPEKVVSSLFKRGMSTPLKKVFKVVTPETKVRIRRLAMEDILRSATQRGSNPLEEVFTSKNFLNTLDQYGTKTLVTMFGRDMTSDMFRFGRVMSLVTKRVAMSGELVAATIALNPLSNIGKLTQLNILSRLLNQKNVFKWLTTGIKAPRTRKGAEALARMVTLSQIMLDEHTQEFNQAEGAKSLQNQSEPLLPGTQFP